MMFLEIYDIVFLNSVYYNNQICLGWIVVFFDLEFLIIRVYVGRFLYMRRIYYKLFLDELFIVDFFEIKYLWYK